MRTARMEVMFHSISAEFLRLVDWWYRELRDALHAAVARVIPRHADRVWISLDAAGGHVQWAQAGRKSDGVRVLSEGQELMPPQLLGHLSNVRPGTRTRVQLDLSRVLLRDIVLPAAAERDLPGVVVLQIQRILPLLPEAMYVDWHLSRRLPDRPGIVVTVAAMKRHDLDSLRDSIEKTGLRVDEICARACEQSHNFNFSSLKLPSQAGVWSRRDRVLAISMVVMLAARGTLGIGDAVYERGRISAIVTDEHERAAQARKLDQQIRARAAPMDRVQRLLREPTAADMVAVLTEASPADTWVYSVEISGGSSGSGPVARLSGFTPTATMLVDRLARNPALRAVKLVKAGGTSGGIGIDRFEISAQMANHADAGSAGARPLRGARADTGAMPTGAQGAP